MTGSWQPGQPVLSDNDRADWQRWRNERKRELQRLRRAMNRRIDYYPDEAAAAAIDALTGPFVGGDYSGAINRIVGEWIEHQRRRTVRQRR